METKVIETKLSNVFNSEDKKLGFDVNTPQFLKEACEGSNGGMYAVCYNIFKGLLAQVAERATELHDPVLDALMIRLNLYEVAPEKRYVILRKLAANYDAAVMEQKHQRIRKLREHVSEDEKIRKALIDFFDKDAFDCGDKSEWVKDIKYKDVVAWLEKQKEHKLNVNDNAKEMFIKALECVEEQNAKGYKLTDCDKNSWWQDFKNYTSCTIEQKPVDEHLKERWKPSDRELSAILVSIGDERLKGSDVVKELRNIYQQLKKLREEDV